MQQAAQDLVNDFPGLHVCGVVGAFETHLEGVPRTFLAMSSGGPGWRCTSSCARQSVRIPGANLIAELEEDEFTRTEISVKFTRESVDRSLNDAGLETRSCFTDAKHRFAAVLATPVREP